MRVLGKVAKGLLGNEKGGDRLASEVEQLLQRVADGVLAEDRHEAVNMLSDLVAGNPQAQKALGMSGLPVLCAVLRDDRSDVEMLRGTLECLTNAIAPNTKQGPDERSAGALNAELVARGQDNVDLLLSLLDDEPVGINDFYVRYHVVQLLTAMTAGGSHRVQEAILAAPMGVVHLMDLVGDTHEVIRNEALLLLVGLTRASPDIQRIAAFEGAFERLLGIIRQEGGADGGIVVQDCLELLNNLLRNDPGNQLMFREMGHLAVLAAMLALPETTGRKLARQKVTNLLCLINSIALLLAASTTNHKVSGKEDQRDANTQALLKTGALERLLVLAFHDQDGSSTVRSIRVQALRCIAQLVSGSAFGQELLMNSSLTWLPTSMPALLSILRVALHAQDAAERNAAEAVLKGFCRGNADGQSMLASTLMSVDGDARAASDTFGAELVKALGNSKLDASSHAASVVAHILDDNPACKSRLLNLPLDTASPSAPPPQLLLPLCVSHLADAIYMPGEAHKQAAASLLRLLVTWLRNCPVAVRMFLATASHLPFLVDVVTGRKGVTSAPVAGLATILLAECLLYNEQDKADTSAVTPSATSIKEIITTRVGFTTFFDNLDGLQADPQFIAASTGSQMPWTSSQAAAVSAADDESDESSDTSPRDMPLENPFDHSFTLWIQKVIEDVRAVLTSGQAGSMRDNDLASATALIRSLEREVESLREHNRDVNRVTQSVDEGRSTGASHLRGADNDSVCVEVVNAQLSTGARIQSLAEELSAVQERNKELEEQLEAALRAAQEAQADASKYESDLEALSGAYANLESHTFQLEARIRNQHEAAISTGVTGEEVESRVAEADAAGEDQLSDLLICLGQEEQKVAILQKKLEELGVDCISLLDGLNDEDEGRR